MQMCTACARNNGVRPLPPAMRPPAPCARCGALEFVRTVPREYTIDPRLLVDGPKQIAAQAYFTYAPARIQFGLLSSRRAETYIEQGYGELEMYACIGCGFVEWYVQAPQDIPIHPHLMTERIRCDESKGGPYR